MANVTYRDIPELLRARKPFQGNGMSGSIAGTGTYSVFSYSTCIAQVARNGKIWINDTKYSKTTSHQQNLCRAWL